MTLQFELQSFVFMPWKRLLVSHLTESAIGHGNTEGLTPGASSIEIVAVHILGPILAFAIVEDVRNGPTSQNPTNKSKLTH